MKPIWRKGEPHRHRENPSYPLWADERSQVRNDQEPSGLGVLVWLLLVVFLGWLFLGV